MVTGDVPGRFFMLKTTDLGSLDTGTPIFFRRLQVGQVASYELDKDGKSLNVKIFVQAPYDQYVNPDTRFWHASGIDVSLSAERPQRADPVGHVDPGRRHRLRDARDRPGLAAGRGEHGFTLFNDRTEAFKPPPRDPQTYLLVFKESVRGLAVGAPVEFGGIHDRRGRATSSAQFDAKTFEFSVPVTIRLDPQRLGVKVVDMPAGADLGAVRRSSMDTLVARGVRAQLRTGNLLTGALYVAFDFFPDAPPATVDWSQNPVQLPTIPGQLRGDGGDVDDIIKKLDQCR